MLHLLTISNYAIIDRLSISFDKGFNIITGETGAGKSILIGALNLVLGARTDSSVLYHRDKKCIVEASFQIELNDRIQRFMTDNDLDIDQEVVLRREIGSNGKSRSFINDTPVNLGQLKAISVWLVDLHQQFDTLELDSNQFQLSVIDAFAKNSALLDKLKQEYALYDRIQKELNRLKSEQELAQKEFDYNQFLYDELEKMSFRENEIEELEEEIKLLSNAESITQQLNTVLYELEESDQSVLSQLKGIQHKLQTLGSLVPEVENLNARMESGLIELRDIANELSMVNRKIHADPQKLAAMDERISAGYKLLRKHNLNTTSELLQLQSDLSAKLESVTNMESRIAALEQEKEKAYSCAFQRAEDISHKRKKQISPFLNKVNNLLKQVGMPNATLIIESGIKELSADGIDSIMFLFDANRSGRSEPIGKVASGGELSRLMLIIKSLVARQLELPTLIFDEIDSGISGEAVKQVGLIMYDLSEGHQLIAITHQPQIAAKASSHFYVYKENKNGRVTTGISRLNREERVIAIAKMLGGEKPSAITLENAREMME